MKYTIIFIAAMALISCQNNSQSSENRDTVYISNNFDSLHIETLSFDSLELYPTDTNAAMMCSELIPIPPFVVKTVKYIQRLDGSTDSSYDYESFSPEEALSQNMFTCEQFIWQKDTLTVSFLDGEERLTKRVAETAREWEKYCGIVFKFGKVQNPDISISFEYGKNESCIGNTSRFQSPSLKLTGLRYNSSPVKFNTYVLHEFGHALGLLHEHQHPAIEVPWNIAYLNSYYKRPPNNWSPEDVKKNIIDKPNYNNCSGSEFDRESIMIYEITAAMVTNSSFVVKPASKLSQKDIQTIGSIYPK